MKINRLLGLVATSTIVATPLCTVSCAKEESKTWNVSFDTRCETFINTIRVEDGGSVDQPEVELKKDGYKFGGWFDNEGCSGEPYTFGKAINSDLVLYAKWDWIYPVEGNKVSITDLEQDIDPTTRTATFECLFDGSDDTMIQFLLPEETPNIVLTETQTSVIDGKFNVKVVYIPTANDETIKFKLKFAYEIQHQPYIQVIEGLQVKYTEPVVPTLIEFESDTETCDEEKIATFKGTWLGEKLKDNKFDDIQIYCLNNEQTLSILDKSEIIIGNDGKFEIKIKYIAASDTGTSSQAFGLKFFYTQAEKQSSTLVEGLTITHQGGQVGSGFIYLYSGSSTLFGQSNVAGSDTNAWRCYYFESKEATSGIDVTSQTEFSFNSATTTHIYFNENSSNLSWDDKLTQGMYWGTVKAHWTSDGFDYYASSSEIALAIYDFIIYSPSLEETKDEDGNYKDTLVKYGILKSDWEIKVGDRDAIRASSASVHVEGVAGITEKFEFDTARNRIEAFGETITPDGDYEMYLVATYTDSITGFTFVARSPNIKITVDRQ